jgi:hypothetical protein
MIPALPVFTRPMNARATIAHLCWLAASIPAYRRFTLALRSPAASQAEWLRVHLRANANTAYGRKHGTHEIRDYAEFARRVPVISYSELEPWIERVKRGETNLLSRAPITRLIPTSGSTGARKLIPFTTALQREFNAAVGPWMIDLARMCPAIAFGSGYWSVTPMGESDAGRTEESVVPIGFDDDSKYLGGARAWLVEAAMAVPSNTRHIRDLDQFRQTVLLHLLRRADLRLISVWHPSFLTLLLDALEQTWDELLGLLAQTDPSRARELRSAHPARPYTIWPRLRVVSCWADGHARGPADELQRRLPNATVQAKGLLATEAFVTIPWGGSHPVAVTSHFFEFRDDAGRIHPIEDLRRGEAYEVIVTTGGGLWRYCLGDRVEVTGFVERTPALTFLGRTGNVSDRCGEKLAEAFVARVLATLFPSARFAMLAPEYNESLCAYGVFLEEVDEARSDGQAVDAALNANPHYALCRRLGQLGPPRVIRVRDAYARFAAAEVARGMRLGDIKPVALSQRTDWAKHFADAD